MVLPPPVPQPPRLIPQLESFEQFKPRTGEERLLDELAAAAHELSKRQREGLTLYEPLPSQLEFHQSGCRVRICRGSTRAGKTLCSAVDVAYAARNCDPAGRFPTSGGVIYIVGFTSKHHSKVTYPMLFKPGAFKIILDRDTNRWRAFRPWDAADAARAKEALPSEPLIPARYLAGEPAWENKREEIPSVIRLTTGWTLYFFSGEGKPPRGQPIDLGWMDEEIGFEGWFSELVSRCVDRSGLIIWSAAPQTGTQQLYELSEKAAEQKGLPGATVEEHVMRLADNAHISAAQREEMSSSFTNEVERMVRIEGEFVLDQQKMYPEFSLKTHGYELQGGRPPPDWTHLLVVDPGSQIAAGLLLAVPPDDQATVPGEIVLYDEVYLARASATTFAAAVRQRAPSTQFHRFVIDQHGSRVHEAGSGQTIVAQYEEAFKAAGLACTATGSGFEYGSDDLMGGVLLVREHLRPQPGRTAPRLRVAVEVSPLGHRTCRLPNFAWEIGRYRHQKIGALITEKPDQRGRVHLMDCARYAVMARPAWEPHGGPKVDDGGPVWRAFMAKQRAAAAANRSAPVFGPASAQRSVA